jgi:hypothetical protein
MGQAKMLGMSWLNPGKKVEIVEQGSELLIRATGTKSSINLLIPVIVCVLGYIAWRDQSLFSSCVCALAFVGAVFSYYKKEDGELRITDRDIVANGDMGGWSGEYKQFRWVDISGLDHREGGEDAPSGLYARTGRWNASCVMAGLNREQSEEVISAIFRRFPYVAMAEDKDGWSLFNNESQLITLDLSKPKK